MNVTSADMPGVYEIHPDHRKDSRGCFVKTFHKHLFAAHGLEVNWAEQYYSVSRKGVLRGLHFQLPPHDHAKMVYCVRGSVFDVVVDLRRGSPTYGKHVTFELSPDDANLVYIPHGCAHGFQVMSKEAILVYNVTTVYAAEHDAGIRWDSARVEWPLPNPILSPRDRSLPGLSEFKSPFVFVSRRPES